MNGAAMIFQENKRAFRDNSFGLENALAGYVRRLWPDKTVVHVAHEWGLSESEAAKVVYANASKNTLNKLLHHKRGGFGLFIRLLEDVTATKLENYIKQRAEEARREEAKRGAEARTWETLSSLDAECHRVAGRPDQPSGPDGRADADLG